MIRSPEDVKALAPDQLQELADEVRQRLIDVVSHTGGHIGAGLGVVELTVALCAAFDSPHDGPACALRARECIRATERPALPAMLLEPGDAKLSVRIEIIVGQETVDERERRADRHG